jgi:hypothetical protein
MIYNINMKKILYILVAAIFLGGMFFSLNTQSHAHMGQNGGCVFSVGGGDMCEMNMVEHITEWKSVFLAITQTVLLAMISVFCIAYLCRKLLKLLNILREKDLYYPTIFRYVRVRINLLLSRGIIHPKLFS